MNTTICNWLQQWSREALLQFGIHRHDVGQRLRETVNRLGLRRRGCRAGRRCKLAAEIARQRVTSFSHATESPLVLSGGQQASPSRVVTSRAADDGNPDQLRSSADCTTFSYGQRIPVVITRYRSAAVRLYDSDRPPVLTRIKVTEQFVPSVFTANIRGGFIRKVDELQAVLQENCVDLACITETWLKDPVPTAVVSIPGYVMQRNDRCDGRRGGGVAVLVRQDLPCRRLIELEAADVESVWLLFRQLRMPRYLSHVVIGAIYHPPSADDRLMTAHILNSLDTVTRSHPHAGIVLIGDFNKLRDAALLSYPLKQIVKSPTRGAATLDKIYTNIQNCYGKPVILPNIGQSDHSAVLMQATSGLRPTDNGNVVSIAVRSQDPNGKALLLQAISEVDWTSLYSMDTCDEMVTQFYNTVTGLVDTYLPMLTVKRHSSDKPWVTDRYRRLIRCRQNALRNGQHARYKSLRNQVQRLTKQLRRKFYARKMEGLRNSNSRKWWQSVKQITGIPAKSSQPLTGLANHVCDGNLQTLASQVNEFFQQVAADLQPLAADAAPPQADFIPAEFIIDQEDVENKLSRINVYKAPGPDGIPNWVLRDFCPYLSGPVCAIFNASIREGFVPTTWKEANIIPVPKVSPPQSIEADLRPISLTSTLGKLLESFVGSWIMQNIGSKIDNSQYGALKKKSTTHALVDMTHHWHSAVDKYQSVRIVFVDFAKAFDHIDHNILVDRMRSLGLSDFIVRWMCAFLQGRQQRVKIGDVWSDWLPVIAGMPQGSYLGPLTFIMMINGLEAADLTHKYVDDTTLTEFLNHGSDSSMQPHVDELIQQATNIGMMINVKKTKEMIIGRALKVSIPPVVLNSEPIQRVDTFKLLGVHISNDLKWGQHVNVILSKAASRLYFLKQLKRAGAGTGDLLCFYNMIVRPVLEYASPVWHSSLTVAQSESLESVQKRAMRIIFPHLNYSGSLFIAEANTLEGRRQELAQRFFRRNVLDETSCLHYLLKSQERSQDIVNRLRSSQTYEQYSVRTEKFRKSFIPFSVSNYQ